jgi:hypothetical protein
MPVLLDITTQTGYDLACALRGPDTTEMGSDILKTMTTSVIRHFIGVPRNGLPAEVNDPESAKAVWFQQSPEQQAVIRTLWNVSNHFRNHIKYAVEQLPKVEVQEYFLWLNSVLTNSAR